MEEREGLGGSVVGRGRESAAGCFCGFFLVPSPGVKAESRMPVPSYQEHNDPGLK